MPTAERGKRLSRDGRWMCIRNHDKDILGVTSTGRCLECKKERQREAREARKKGLATVTITKQECVNGHDRTLYAHPVWEHCILCKRERDRAEHDPKLRTVKLPNLREFRLGLGLSIAEFARKIGVTRNQLSEYERGIHDPRLKTAEKVVSAVAELEKERREKLNKLRSMGVPV